MANKKFSQFNQLASATGTTELVGFDGANNVRVLASTLGGGGGKSGNAGSDPAGGGGGAGGLIFYSSYKITSGKIIF